MVPEPQPNIWVAKESSINNDFEESRRCLLNNYHSYVQTHAGYLIALILGLFAVIATFKDFLAAGLTGQIAILGLIGSIVIASAFMGLRIIYWSSWASGAITITEDNAIRYFNDENKIEKTYLTKAPNTHIIQCGIKYAIKQNIAKNEISFIRKLAIKTARKSF